MNHLSDLSLTHIQPLSDTAPVVIGGIGGSGTRVVAGLLQQLGFDIGSDLNDSLDDLSFTALFKRPALWPLCEHLDQLTVALATYLTARGHPTPPEVTSADQSGRAQLLLNDIDSEIAWQEVAHRRIDLPHYVPSVLDSHRGAGKSPTHTLYCRSCWPPCPTCDTSTSSGTVWIWPSAATKPRWLCGVPRWQRVMATSIQGR